MGRTLYAERAEQEANRIGMKFAHSNDVVQDMSRAYHVDFSDIKVHTDSAADSRVRAAGKDALAQGGELFFGKGIFESSEPEDKALVAHEFAHTMQQGAAGGGEAAVSESAPMGAEQGGIRDWFKGLFSRKPKISEPQLLDVMEPTTDKEAGYKLMDADGKSRKYRFMNTQSRAIHEMAQNATPEQLRDPVFRKLILDDYKRSGAQRLERYKNDDFDTAKTVFRADYPGEMATYNMLLRANMPEHISQYMSDNYTSTTDENGNTTTNEDALMDYAGAQIMENPAMQEILQASMDMMGTSPHFQGEHEGRRSAMAMNTVMLRALAPDIAMKHHNPKASVAFQKAVKDTSDSAGGKRFMNLLRRRG